MSDNIRIDSHKLIYHPDAVAGWLKGENIYPIEIEIGLTNACNHRCTFCAVDYTGYKSSQEKALPKFKYYTKMMAELRKLLDEEIKPLLMVV